MMRNRVCGAKSKDKRGIPVNFIMNLQDFDSGQTEFWEELWVAFGMRL